jgi:hypothetical protein
MAVLCLSNLVNDLRPHYTLASFVTHLNPLQLLFSRSSARLGSVASCMHAAAEAE